MITSRFFRLLPITSLVLCLPGLVLAATLQAKVVDVQSGSTLIVSNINRPLRIKLKGVAPPEAGQPFNVVARDHLRNLVLEKTVVVEYTHLMEGYLEAKVFVNGIDIASQMLRDGVVWYDHAGDYQLTDTDRDLYSRCEQAARFEKRGLWQDPAPVAPWDFRQKQAFDAAVATYETPARSVGRKKGKQRVSNGDLLGSLLGSGANTSAPRLIDDYGTPDRWMKYESTADHFSILIPSNGIEDSYSGPDASGHPITAHIVAAGNAQEFYALLGTKSVVESKSDLAASDAAIRALVSGMNQGAQHSGSDDLISLRPVQQLKLGDFSGKLYTLSSQRFSGAARVYTKMAGEQRELFVLLVLHPRGGESLAERFLTSFKVTAH